MDIKYLRFAVFCGACIPIIAGAWGIACSISWLGGIADGNALDSHFRYLSGLLLGLGLAFWGCIPKLDERTSHFPILVCIVVVGGLARLWSAIESGMPTPQMQFGLGMELIITPSLGLWHQYLLRNHKIELR